MGLSYFRATVLVIGGILFLTTWIAMARRRATFGEALRWSLLWLGVCVMAVYPRITNKIAHALGVDSGRFLILYCAVIVLAGCLVMVYARTRRLSREITLLVREVAMQREDEHHSQDKDESSA